MAGYTTEEAEDGEAALQLCADDSRPIDLVISDLVMPKVDGWELAKRLHQTRPDLPLLFISGKSPEAPVIGGRAYTLIQKPFRLDALVRAVNRAMERRGLTAQ
jgi:DNA-binding NtrC family response regulator